MFIPFLVVFLSLLPYFLQSAEQKMTYLDAFETARKDDFGWINQFVSVVHIVFSLGNLVFYLKWEGNRSEEFSALEAVRVKWLRQFLLFMFLVTLFGVMIFFARIWNVTVLSDIYRFHFIGVVLLFYWMSYKALTQPVLFGIFSNPPSAQAVAMSAAEKKMPDGDSNLPAVFRKVTDVLERDRLYLKTDLTLTELASRAGFSRNQVSQAINTLFKGNFFDFINDFRVEEFKRQALDPSKQHLTQAGIALESGFNSKASFYAVFKKKTGMTPSEFLEKESRLVS